MTIVTATTPQRRTPVQAAIEPKLSPTDASANRLELQRCSDLFSLSSSAAIVLPAGEFPIDCSPTTVPLDPTIPMKARYAVLLRGKRPIFCAPSGLCTLNLLDHARQHSFTTIFLVDNGGLGARFEGITFSHQSYTDDQECPESSLLSTGGGVEAVNCVFKGCRGKAFRIERPASIPGLVGGVLIDGCLFTGGWGQAIHLMKTRGARIIDTRIEYNVRVPNGGSEAGIFYGNTRLLFSRLFVKDWGDLCFRGNALPSQDITIEDSEFLIPESASKDLRAITIDSGVLVNGFRVDQSSFKAPHATPESVVRFIVGRAERISITSNYASIPSYASPRSVFADVSGYGVLDSNHMDGPLGLRMKRLDVHIFTASYNSITGGVVSLLGGAALHNSQVYGAIDCHSSSIIGCEIATNSTLLLKGVGSCFNRNQVVSYATERCLFVEPGASSVDIADNSIGYRGPGSEVIRIDKAEAVYYARNRCRYYGKAEPLYRIPSDAIQENNHHIRFRDVLQVPTSEPGMGAQGPTP